MSGIVGLEVAPARAAMVHVESGRGGLVVRHFAWIDGLSGIPELTARLTMLRVERRLPKHACLIAWGGGERTRALAAAVGRAGFRVDEVLSPAEAVVAAANPEVGEAALKVGPTAYLLLHTDGGHLAVALGSRLVMERPVRFTYPKPRPDAGGGPAGTRQRLLHRYTLLAAIVAVLEPAFRDVARVHGQGVRQIVTCGSVPELRSLTLPLAEEFDVEVETLDGIDGVDATKLPEPADVFRERAAALRLALAGVMRPVATARRTPAALIAAAAGRFFAGTR
jgi:hypothetical protein